MQFVSKDALHFFSDNKVLLSLVMGLGLSACCGFRVFVPLLAASIATKMGILHLGDGFQWMGSTAARRLVRVSPTKGRAPNSAS